MIGFAAQRLMDLETEALTGVADGARSETRRVQRNGDRGRDWETGTGRLGLGDWDWETRAGCVELRIPKLRKVSACAAVLEPRRTAEQALTAVIHRHPGRLNAQRGGSRPSHGRHGGEQKRGLPALRRDR